MPDINHGSPIVWIVLFAIGFVLWAYEMLALATNEKYFPTISRWIWNLEDVGWLPRSWVALITLGFWFILGIWMAIHFYLGECSFKTC